MHISLLPAESIAFILQTAANDLESPSLRNQLLRAAMLLKPFHPYAKKLLYAEIQVDYTSTHPYTVEQDIQSMSIYHPARVELERLSRLRIDSKLVRLARTLQASPSLKGTIYHLYLTATQSVVNDTIISRSLQTIRKYLAASATISLCAPTHHLPILIRSPALAKLVSHIQLASWPNAEYIPSSKVWRLLGTCTALTHLQLNKITFDDAVISALPPMIQSLHFYGCSDFPYNHLSLSLQNPNCLPALKDLVIAPSHGLETTSSGCDSGMELDQECESVDRECGIWVKMQLEASAAGRRISLRWK